MIYREYGFFNVSCDGCNRDIDPDGFDTWSEAKDAVADSEWQMRRVSGEWEHYCPDCQN